GRTAGRGAHAVGEIGRGALMSFLLSSEVVEMNRLQASHSSRPFLASVVISVASVALFVSTVLAQPQPGDSLYRPLTGKERQSQERITARTGPNGFRNGTIPPRNAATVTYYSSMSDEDLWKHLLLSRQIAVVGIKSKSARRGFFAGSRLVSTDTLKAARTSLLRIKGVSNAVVETANDLRLPTMADGRPYPAVIVKFERETLSAVRALDFVDFVEPLYPAIEYFDGIGCALASYAGITNDVIMVAGVPNLIPWSYKHHAIREAWGLFPGTAPGFGVDLFETDTGVFRSQRQFWELFSPPTTPVTRSFSEILWGGNAFAKCSHGTRIAGLAAAPLDASSPLNVVGIAWGSSLRSQKVGDGVVPATTPTTALASAITEAANTTIALPLRKRVLLMAWGLPAGSHVVRDAIESAFDSNPNLIMVAAAGTNVDTVVFPANMRRETVAVSIVDAAEPTIPSYTLVPATEGEDRVAYGDEVDFVAVNSITTKLWIP